MFALRVNAAVWSRICSLSYIVRGNLLLVGLWLACYAAFYFASLSPDGDAGIAVLPFYILLTGIGMPWESWTHFDATNVHPILFSANNVLYEALNVRGGFINVTLACLILDAWRWQRARFRGDKAGLAPVSDRKAASRRLTLVTLVIVGAMGVLPWTSFARSEFLADAWVDASRPSFSGTFTSFHGNSVLRFPDQVQRMINGQTTATRRNHVMQLAIAVEDAASVDLGNNSAVASVERELSAALLCLASTSQYENYNDGDIIGSIRFWSIDSPARARAYTEFPWHVGSLHARPSGDGCGMATVRLRSMGLAGPQNSALSPERSVIHLAIGDSAQSLEDTLHLTEMPTNSTIQGRSVGEIRLQARGIWIFLDASNHAYQFRFDAPFAGDIDRARIGNDFAQVASALGAPVKEIPMVLSSGKSDLYAPQSGGTIRVDYDGTGRAQTIRVLAGSVTFSESSTPPAPASAGARPVYPAVPPLPLPERSSRASGPEPQTAGSDANPLAAHRSYLPAPGIITRFRNMDHSATFPEPTVPEILDLGRLSGGVNSSYASAVSANGKVVVGSANHGNYSNVAFTWTPATGMVSLDQSFFIRPEAYASAVSGDGSVVVGAQALEQTGMMRAFRWTRKTGIVTLGILPGTDRSEAQSVSADGSVVVGLSGGTAFRWTKATGMVALPGRSIIGPVVVTGDGMTVYGTEMDSSGFHVIRWDSNGSAFRYTNPPEVSASFVWAVASDGSVVVGQQFAKDRRAVAVAWYSPSKVIYFGSLHGGTYSKATAVNANGTVIVGVATDGATHDQSTVFRWTRATGMQSLADWIVSRGGPLPPSNPTMAGGVSADGLTVVGSLRNGDPFVAFDPRP